MRNGELEVVFSGSPTLIVGYLQGLETMIIGTTSNKLDSVVFARPEVQSVQELRGKTVGVNRLKAISDVAARLAFKRAGLEPDVDIFTRGTGGLAEAMAALETGAVDGASLSPPLVFEARKRGYRELLSVADLDIQFLNSAIGVTKKVLDERPELGERYLRALAQATSRLRTDRDFSIQVIGKYTQMDDRELLGMTVDYYRNQYALDPYPEPAALQTAIDAEEHPGARTLKPEEIIDFRAADALRRSGFLDTLPR
jgi:NitT/TauT family transport system substrate-binding protein